jgi:hypothetical protein
MTDPTCESGAEMCLEVYQKLKKEKRRKKRADFDVVVHVARLYQSECS